MVVVVVDVVDGAWYQWRQEYPMHIVRSTFASSAQLTTKAD